ncbi:MAG TPA: TonB-dependent receptor [Bacteroidales bacterium]|nr:TonB-dependent receptor [Bacteroidales bacterium]
MNRLFSFFIAGLLLSGHFHLAGQEARLQLRDARSREAVPFAHILFQSFDNRQRLSAIADMDGKAVLTITTAGIVQVSALGYNALSDTLRPGEQKQLKLQPQIFNMDEVVVTGQYSPQPVDRSIFRVKVIGAKHIEQRASNNLSELMTGELNIRGMVDGALGSRITLQGLGGEHIKFLIDGVPVIGRMNGNIDISQLNLYNVRQIEIIEGPMSVIYGSNALAGVINILTKDQTVSRINSRAEAYYESVGVYNFNASTMAMRNRWTISAAGARNFFDGYSAVDTVRSKRWKPKRQYNADLSAGYSFRGTRARLNLSYFNELLRDKGNLIKPYFETAFDSDFTTNRLTTRFDLSQKVLSNRYLNVLGSYAYYDRRKNTWFNDLTTLEKVLTNNAFDQDTSRFDQWLLRSEFSKSDIASKFNYQLGIDLNMEQGYGRRILDKYQQIGDYSAFLSLKLQPSARLMLQPGTRYSYNTRYKAPMVYSLNMKYDLRESLSLRASAAKGFRAPSLKELYLEFVDVNHNIRGNENLKAESSQNYNLALRYHHEKPSYDYGFEASLFHNSITNSITLAALNTQDQLYTYVNLDRMITQGYQIQFNNRIYPWLELKFGVGQTGRQQIQKDKPKIDMIYSTDVIAQAGYTWRKTGLRFGTYYKYNGDYPEVFVAQDGTIFRTIMQGYHTLDMNVSRAFFDRKIQLQLGAKNLFNNTNIAVLGSSGGGGIHSGGGGGSSPVGWGRTFFVRMNVNFDRF